MVKLLLENRADVNLANKDGQTPLDMIKGPPAGWSIASQVEAPGVAILRLVRSSSPYAVPVRVAFPGQRQAELSENQKTIMDALKQRGALEDLPRLDQIQVRRSGRGFSATVFTKGTKDWNRFTLLELIAVQYDLLGDSPGGSKRARETMSVLAGRNRSLAFPDFSRIRVRRLAAEPPGWREDTVDLRPVVEGGDCSKDVPLQWVDVVEIPEADHLLNIEWPGFSAAQITNFFKCLSRQVEIIVGSPAATGGSTR